MVIPSGKVFLEEEIQMCGTLNQCLMFICYFLELWWLGEKRSIKP